MEDTLKRPYEAYALLKVATGQSDVALFKVNTLVLSRPILRVLSCAFRAVERCFFLHVSFALCLSKEERHKEQQTKEKEKNTFTMVFYVFSCFFLGISLLFSYSSIHLYPCLPWFLGSKAAPAAGSS